MKFLKIPAAQCREMARNVNPVTFDAEAWVRLAQATGMRYLVFTATQDFDAGVLDIAAAAEQELLLRPERELGQDLIYCQSIQLERLP
jgi:hypothetical protein